MLLCGIRTSEKTRAQMRATKLVSNPKDLPYTTRLKKLKLLTLTHRRLRGDVIQTFKLVEGLAGCLLEHFFTFPHYNKRTFFQARKAKMLIIIYFEPFLISSG